MLSEKSLAYKPFRHPWAVELCALHEQVHWVKEEADLSQDLSDWQTRLTQDERDFVTDILRLFTQSDVQVGSNYYEFLIPAIKNNEARVMLGSFAAREGEHQRAYALVSDTLGLPEEEFLRFREYREMSQKLDFMGDLKIDSPTDVARAFFRTGMAEGVGLFGPFTELLSFQRKGKMIGACNIVEWSIRDESLHVLGNSKMFRQWCYEHPWILTPKFIKGLEDDTRELVRLEDAFIRLSHRDRKVEDDMTEEAMSAYIRYLADRRLSVFGLNPIFGATTNPFKWLTWVVAGSRQQNFFEKRVTDYGAATLTGRFTYGSAAA